MGGNALRHKQCCHCRSVKPLEDFYNSKTSYDGKRSWCKSCEQLKREEHRLLDPDAEYKLQRKGNLRRKYDLAPEDVETMLSDQNYQCKICKVSSKHLHIDHCHRTGDIRGLLCFNCNIGLGQFKDDLHLLQSAIDYIRCKGNLPM